MSKTVRTIISVVSALLVTVLLCGVVVWIVRREGLTVYVECNDKKYYATDKNSSIGQLDKGIHTFTVGSLTGEEVMFEVKITPNTDKSFDYVEGGNVYSWKNRKDTNFTEYFNIELTDNGFTLYIPDELTIQSILEHKYGEAEVISDSKYTADFFLLTVTCENSEITIAFGIPLIPPVPPDGVTIIPDHITF